MSWSLCLLTFISPNVKKTYILPGNSHKSYQNTDVACPTLEEAVCLEKHIAKEMAHLSDFKVTCEFLFECVDL